MQLINHMKIYSDQALSRRLETTEARYNAEFVRSRLRMFPNCGAKWIELEGTYAMFDGLDSPLTQTFGLGLFEKLSLDTIEKLEKFYQQFSAPIFHEVSPFSDASHMDILHTCGYQPIELTSILYKDLVDNDATAGLINPELTTHPMKKGEEELWALTSAQGWSAEAPGLSEFIYEFAQIASQGRGVVSFFANLQGKPIATAMVYIDDGVALLAGDSTIAEGRKLGAQTALIDARLKYATDHGCSIAMMAASPGSQSQKNAEKQGFRLAYTRTKWKLTT